MADPHPTLLAVDTSTMHQSLALSQHGQPTLTREQPTRRGHGSSLLTSIRDLLHDGGLTFNDLDGLVFGNGPGSFTGLRVGLACLKGLAYAHKLPLFPASSLEALARPAQTKLTQTTLVVPALDARKKELYAGLYRYDPTQPQAWSACAPDRCLPPEALASWIQEHRHDAEPVLLRGEGITRYKERLDAALENIQGIQRTEEECWPEATALIQSMQGSLPPAPNLALLEPNYQRLSEAEERFGTAPRLRP